MKTKLWFVAIVFCVLTPFSLHAQPPVGSTGQCKDNTYTNAASKSGACRGHQGVKTWFATAGTPAAAPATAPAPKPAPAPVAPPPPAPKPAPAATSGPAPAAAPARTPASAASTTAKTPAPGGGPGKVWVNLESKVYHCPGTQFYGTTKSGKYMSEADAKAMGAHADHDNPCTK
jgi:hypothetical protein